MWLQVQKFSDIVDTLGADTISAIATSGPEMEVWNRALIFWWPWRYVSQLDIPVEQKNKAKTGKAGKQDLDQKIGFWT